MIYLYTAIAEFFGWITLILNLPPYITQSIANFFSVAAGFNEEEDEHNRKIGFKQDS